MTTTHGGRKLLDEAQLKKVAAFLGLFILLLAAPATPRPAAAQDKSFLWRVRSE